MRISKIVATGFSLTLMFAVGLSVNGQNKRRRASKPNSVRGLSPAAQQEADWIRGMPDGDKAKILKAAGDLHYLLRLEQKGDYESYYFWGAYDCLVRKSGGDWSEVEQVTKLILRDGQVAKLMDETAYILMSARQLVEGGA
jgi:hypothetical protein